jgi:hypothetical protein
MSLGRNSALAAARQLLRTFASAPEPRRHARMIYAELSAVDGWTRTEQTAVDALGSWLQDQPPIAELKPRCAKIVAGLGQV